MSQKNLACFDVAYTAPQSFAACVEFSDWDATQPTHEHVVELTGSEEYVPGQFYKRELPPILEALKQTAQPPDILIVDGYVQLSRTKPGLGQILAERLDRGVIVVGVAKKAFAGNDVALEIFRGQSRRPLYVTALGMPVNEAAAQVTAMSGDHRLPTLLKRAAQLVRAAANESKESPARSEAD